MIARIKRNDEDGIDEDMTIVGSSYEDIDNQVYELNKGLYPSSKWSIERYDLSKKNDFEEETK